MKNIQQPIHKVNGSVTKSEGFHLVNMNGTIGDSTEYRLLIRAHVIDNEGCHGRDSNFTYGRLCKVY